MIYEYESYYEEYYEDFGMRYFLELAYNGTRYSGYQEQRNQPTVQSAIESALYTILRVQVKIVGCGRTDSGVHALQYFAHFDSDQILSEEFVYKLNNLSSLFSFID